MAARQVRGGIRAGDSGQGQTQLRVSDGAGPRSSQEAELLGQGQGQTGEGPRLSMDVAAAQLQCKAGRGPW